MEGTPGSRLQSLLFLACTLLRLETRTTLQDIVADFRTVWSRRQPDHVTSGSVTQESLVHSVAVLRPGPQSHARTCGTHSRNLSVVFSAVPFPRDSHGFGPDWETGIAWTIRRAARVCEEWGWRDAPTFSEDILRSTEHVKTRSGESKSCVGRCILNSPIGNAQL